MKIELFYFDGCPNYLTALRKLNAAIRELDLTERAELVKVKDNDDAEQKHFLGSPSIRIDGRDIEGLEEPPDGCAMCCRRYRLGDQILNYPPEAKILEALRARIEARQNSNNHH